MLVHCIITYVEHNGKVYKIENSDVKDAIEQAINKALKEWDKTLNHGGTQLCLDIK